MFVGRVCGKKMERHVPSLPVETASSAADELPSLLGLSLTPQAGNADGSQAVQPPAGIVDALPFVFPPPSISFEKRTRRPTKKVVRWHKEPPRDKTKKYYIPKVTKDDVLRPSSWMNPNLGSSSSMEPSDNSSSSKPADDELTDAEKRRRALEAAKDDPLCAILFAEDEEVDWGSSEDDSDDQIVKPRQYTFTEMRELGRAASEKALGRKYPPLESSDDSDDDVPSLPNTPNPHVKP